MPNLTQETLITNGFVETSRFRSRGGHNCEVQALGLKATLFFTPSQQAGARTSLIMRTTAETA